MAVCTPRNMGIATHASFYLNKPTIGVAKSYYHIREGLDYIEPDITAGSFTDIVSGLWECFTY